MSIRYETCGGEVCAENGKKEEHRPNSPIYCDTVGQLAGM